MLVGDNGGQALDKDGWAAVTVDGFRQFRATLDFYNENRNVADATPPTDSQASNNSPKMELLHFKRGIKRDAAIYPTLREDKNWDNWNRSLHAQARAHDVCEVLDK